MKRGFTLIEMLVVIGIIAVLIGVSVTGYSAMTRRAQKVRAEELVSNVATALESILQERGKWPQAIAASVGQDEYRLGPEVAAVLASRRLMSLSFHEDKDTKKITMTGLDKYGVLDPWAMAVLKNNASAGLDALVPSGGKIKDHIVRFSVDVEGRGFTKVDINGETFDIRGSVAVWSCGMDGKFGSFSQAGRTDDVYSFTPGQRVNQ